MMEFFRRCVRRRLPSDFMENESGAAAVEFVLVLPLMVTFLFGALDGGLYFNLKNNMTTELRVVARDMAFGNLDAEEAKTELESRLEALAPLDYIVSVVEENGGDVFVVTANLSSDELKQNYSLTGTIPFPDMSIAATMRKM